MNLSHLIRTHQFLYQKPSEGDGGGDEDPDDDTGGEDPGKVGKPNFTPEQQKFIDDLLGNTRKAEREKARKEAEAKSTKEKEDADKKALEEQGKFKELAEAAEKKAADEKARADAASAETDRLKLQRKFDDAVTEAGFSFVSPKAAEDAFGHLNTEAVGDDYAGLPDEVERLTDEYDYLFGEETVKVPDIDAVTKSNVNNKKVTQKDLREKKKRSGRYSAV